MVQSLVEIGAVTPPDAPLRGTRRFVEIGAVTPPDDPLRGTRRFVEIGAVTPPDDPLRGTRRSSPYAGDVAGTYTIERSRSSVRELAAGFEAMLLQAAFAPLAKAIGFYGETVVGIATRSMLRDDSGLTSTFERALPQDAGR